MSPTGTGQLQKIHGLAGVAAVWLFLVFLAFVLSLFGDTDRYVLLTYGLAAPLVLVTPAIIVRKGFYLFEPLAFLLGSLLVSTVGRSLYVVFSEDERANFLLFEQTFGEVARNGWWFLLALIVFAIGYESVKSRLAIERWPLFRRTKPASNSRLLTVSLFAMALAIASALIVKTTFDVSLDDLSSLSVKRPGQVEIEGGGVVYTSNAAIRILGSFAESVFYFLLSLYLIRGRKFKPPQVILLAALFVANALLPFLTSSRFSIIIVLINAGIIYFVVRRVAVSRLLAILLPIVLIIYGMGELRTIGHTGERSSTGVVASVFGSGNFLDIPRTSGIMDRMPTQHDHLWGQSYLSLLTAPIPKSLWPDKPNPSYGPWVKSELYHYPVRNHGWPPGFIAEAYMNFSYVGIFLVPLVLGAFYRLLFNSFRPLLTSNLAALLVYVTIAWPVSVGVMGLNVAQGVMQTLLALAPMVVVLLLLTRRRATAVRPRFPVRIDAWSVDRGATDQ